MSQKRLVIPEGRFPWNEACGKCLEFSGIGLAASASCYGTLLTFLITQPSSTALLAQLPCDTEELEKSLIRRCEFVPSP